MKGPHFCDCMCALCERVGGGAFGPQPDGRAGITVVRSRRIRRPRYSLLNLTYRMLLRRGIRSTAHP